MFRGFRIIESKEPSYYLQPTPQYVAMLSHGHKHASPYHPLLLLWVSLTCYLLVSTLV